MAITYETNEYQIPRGRLFFDIFDESGATTGERALGNAPSFTLEIATEKAEHFSSESGLRQKDKSVVLEVTRTGKMVVDNMSLENVGLFISGTSELIDQSVATGEEEELTVQTGRHYQLGVSASVPTGVRQVSTVVVTNGLVAPDDVTYVEGDDYELDEEMGRLQILADGDIEDDDDITVTYDVPASEWDQIASGAVSELTGAMRLIADNASGANRDFYFPSVSLIPSGALPIIAEGTDWAKVEFEVEVLKPANLEAIYIDGRPAPQPAPQ
jgi:hypothetical protein